MAKTRSHVEISVVDRELSPRDYPKGKAYMHAKVELLMQTGKRSYSRASQAHRGTQKRSIMGGYKECVQKTILRLFPPRLSDSHSTVFAIFNDSMNSVVDTLFGIPVSS